MSAGQWYPAGLYRVVLSSGEVWCETSNRSEAVAALRSIRGNMVTTYANPEDPRQVGPDPGARFEQAFRRAEAEWCEEVIEQ